MFGRKHPLLFSHTHHAVSHPGVTIGVQLALPVLQERLDCKALEYAAHLAEKAESDVIRMEVRFGTDQPSFDGWLLSMCES